MLTQKSRRGGTGPAFLLYTTKRKEEEGPSVHLPQ